MSDQNSSSPQVVVVPVPASAPAAAPAPNQTAPKEGGDDFRQMSEKQFAKRLQEAEERGQKRLLKELGIEKPQREESLKQIKEGLLALTKREQVEAEQKAQLEALRQKASRAEELEPVFKSFVDEKFSTLSEEAQKFIAESFGEDMNARWKAIQTAIKSGMVAKGAAVPAEAPKAEAKPPNPATTMANDPPTAPKSAGQMNLFEQWEALKASGQTYLAATFYNTHMRAIESQRK